MPRARGRIASERVADFSQVLSPRVAARRRPTPSRHEQGLGRASRRVAYCCICNRRVWASGACAGLRVAAENDESERTRPHCVAYLALPKLENAHSKIKRARANWQSHARNDDQIRKQRLCVPMGHFPSQSVEALLP